MTFTCGLASPIGTLLLRSDGSALTEVRLDGGADDAAATRGDPGCAVLRAARDQLRAYFRRDLVRFELPLEPAGSPFQRGVWDALLDIPYGATETYGGLARRLGRPGASRAVGLANGRNPIPIIVPCHRVVGARGELTGYSGGLENKRWLLAHEARRAGRGQLALAVAEEFPAPGSASRDRPSKRA